MLPPSLTVEIEASRPVADGSLAMEAVVDGTQSFRESWAPADVSPGTLTITNEGRIGANP